MAQPIVIKNSSVAAKVPTTSDLALGELGINTSDGKLYTKIDDGTERVIELGTNVLGTFGPFTIGYESGTNSLAITYTGA